MKDFFGNNIDIGDRIIFAARNSSSQNIMLKTDIVGALGKQCLVTESGSRVYPTKCIVRRKKADVDQKRIRELEAENENLRQLVKNSVDTKCAALAEFKLAFLHCSELLQKED